MFCDYVVSDLLGHIPGISARAMFGGYGLYQDGVIFGIIAGDELYFKVGESNKARYERMHSRPFVYTGHGKPMSMSYWLVNTEDRELLREMVHESYLASLASKKLKVKSPPKGYPTLGDSK